MRSARVAARVVLAPKLARFTRDYPNVVLDVTTMAVPRVDLVAGGFDAGIRLGEFIERDMIAVRVSRDQRAAIVGAPRYFESHATPLTPNDLTGHPCINFRQGAEGLYRWEFDKGDQSITVAVRGPLVTEDTELIIRAAIEGVGLAYAIEEHVLPYLASGVLVRVLEDWSAPFPGTSSITRAGGSSPPRSRRSSTRSGCESARGPGAPKLDSRAPVRMDVRAKRDSCLLVVESSMVTTRRAVTTAVLVACLSGAPLSGTVAASEPAPPALPGNTSSIQVDRPTTTRRSPFVLSDETLRQSLIESDAREARVPAPRTGSGATTARLLTIITTTGRRRPRSSLDPRR